MPFKRPTLSELRDGNRKFMQAELEDVGALLRFANLKDFLALMSPLRG